MATPSPSSTRANHSPSTAPMSASPTAMRAAANRNGRAWGRRSRQKISRPLAFTLRSTSSVAGSTERRPATALNRNGTKHTRVVMAMIGLMPAPSQITKAGA